MALLRQSDEKAALAALGRALRLDPENRLASLTQQLAATVSELRVGGNLDALPDRGDWCTDDDSAVVRLTDGRFPGCTAAVAAMAGHRHAGGGRERAVCLLCPSACGLCPAPAAWSDRWWAPPAKEHSGPLPTRCTIERRSADSMTAASFAREFGRRRVPVMLTGLADHWALQRWLNASDPPAPADAGQPLAAAGTMGAWLRDSLHSADALSRNQYLNLDRVGGGGAAGPASQQRTLPLLRAYVPSPSP